ncbi:MAG: glycosyl hydrolase family 39 [Acidobacteria bacterium]|nr:glycosyl hydrolase family 39 [Acidobacteriota bacterium]
MAGTSVAESAKVQVNWDKVVRVSQTSPSLLCAINPYYRRNSPIHDKVFQALKDLNADYASHLGWFPYPKLAVAELEPPQDGKTSWDFSLLDPIMLDFFEATKGHPVLVNLSTIPVWMFKTPQRVAYPDDPNKEDWLYQQGSELRDPTRKELADYFARLASWYTQGGFKDEYGKWHESGHHYKIDYWGVLNEIDIEHFTTPEEYTARYDAIVEAVRAVSPNTKFVAMMLALPTMNPQYFEYFLDPKNHKPGIPLDMVGYHFYGLPAADQPADVHQFTFFDMADQFLSTVRYIEVIRKRLSPQTRTIINELGVMLPDDFKQGTPGFVPKPEDPGYRNRFATTYAYLFAQLTRMGIDVAAESQLLGFPGQFASVSMLDPKTGDPNATYWVLAMLIRNIQPGDKIVDSRVEIQDAVPFLPPFVEALAFTKPDGTKKVLLINKRDRSFQVELAGANSAQIEFIDRESGAKPPRVEKLRSEKFTLGSMGIAVVTLPAAGTK